MKGHGTRLGFIAVLLAWCGWIAFTGTSTATMDHQKEAKAAGVAVKDCAYCHVDKLPKKEGRTSPTTPASGSMAEKDKRGAKKVDGAWLKDYPGK